MVTVIIDPHNGPGVYSASDRNEYQKIVLRGEAGLERKADNLCTIYKSTVYNVGSSTAHNPMGLRGMLQG
jgi:hypothetical protein